MQVEQPARRELQEVQTLISAIPYADRLLHLSITDAHDATRGYMPRNPALLGNERFGALHGGALAGLLEITALAELLSSPSVRPMPIRLSISFDFFRAASDADTHARAQLIRIGRTTASVRVTAWQDNESKPVAEARVQFFLRG